MEVSEYREKLKKGPKTKTFWRDVAAEFFATFFLVSSQCCLVLKWTEENDGIGGVVEVALGMGFIVCTMVWTLGDFGGGHMNPAVTLALVASMKVTFLRGLIYIVAQCAGGLAGAGFVYGVTPAEFRGSLGVTSLGPSVSTWQGFLVEAWITCILVITILGSTNEKRKGNVFMASIPIGFAITLGLFLGWVYTGGSMNPARSLGPAVVMNRWKHHWVYWVGPFAGALVAAGIYQLSDFIDRKELEEQEFDIQFLPYASDGSVPPTPTTTSTGYGKRGSVTGTFALTQAPISKSVQEDIPDQEGEANGTNSTGGNKNSGKKVIADTSKQYSKL